VVDVLSKSLSLALHDPKVQKIIRQDGALEKDLPTDEFTAYVKADIKDYRDNIDPAAIAAIVP
jgi:tripartite-type tricarboxylate transporter receptor subunit TctC